MPLIIVRLRRRLSIQVVRSRSYSGSALWKKQKKKGLQPNSGSVASTTTPAQHKATGLSSASPSRSSRAWNCTGPPSPPPSVRSPLPQLYKAVTLYSLVCSSPPSSHTLFSSSSSVRRRRSPFSSFSLGPSPYSYSSSVAGAATSHQLRHRLRPAIAAPSHRGD